MRTIVQCFAGLERGVRAVAVPATRLVGLAPEARRFAARAWFAVPAVELSLRVLGLRRTLRWIEAVPPARRQARPSTTVEDGGRLVRGAYRRHPLGGHCLSQAAVQYLLHRRDGVPARFVVGVRHVERNLDAHAWVEPAGAAAPASGFQPILERGDARGS
jgi:hypothetical protein